MLIKHDFERELQRSWWRSAADLAEELQDEGWEVIGINSENIEVQRDGERYAIILCGTERTVVIQEAKYLGSW